ncbi:gliding motility-associated ABC transporter ATP-binding subunit GldA [Mesohalobacter halotolerans]|uniref:Gliding motility-associated ABC transporter ATP-binding subunit GldA n=1 Tax=Mesohalobacter halotolerans TaxID=1883405 RepID=A0A4U5TQ07_9FLAO|nr:gliding motility-associated ABC transporter ATP-binding subunit GldA [Mesohalobacter halotolerans]MBS3739229.1 gliding motility-associated ABC transporter ATP-binding subunit GldA [Psychroflexus sp.]TKS56270.1 gliding motility-associated ABC transporter ATP-binding subunit GldA [Mesohalobacter halotolerans]
MSISTKNITKHYQSQKALDKVSFNIPKGQIVGFLGPNGAGKSTMMKILTGYIHHYQGQAKINDIDVNEDPLFVQSQIGYLPEHNPLYLDMYVKEFLKFNVDIYKCSPKRISEVIKFTHLDSESHKKIHQLSKGYRQRVGLAAALIHDPEILILDEPTTGLDPNQLVEIRGLIKKIGRDKTTLLSTHIMQEVEAICDRVIIMNQGQLVADELLDDLTQHQQQIIHVEFDYSVELEALNRLHKVKKAKEIGLYEYELYFDTTQDMRSYIFDFAHDIGLKIKTLNRKHQSLEDLFRELTIKT